MEKDFPHQWFIREDADQLHLSFWLYMVTYLQHHSDDGKLYTDDTFTFERGAFQTVDRRYGKWINRLSHHMIDGHFMYHSRTGIYV